MRDSIGKRRPLDELEDKRGNAARCFESVDRGNAGMVQGREKPCLTVEPGDAFGIVDKRCWQDLDRDVSTELIVTSAIDLSHATRPKRRDDPVRTELGGSHRRHGLGIILPKFLIQTVCRTRNDIRPVMAIRTPVTTNTTAVLRAS